jgi:hypothetical protein
MAPYHDVFCRDAGFEHVRRDVTGLVLSPNKPLQGIYDPQVWGGALTCSRRAMHEAVFEAGWAGDELMPCHWQVVALDHRGRGCEVLSLDWTSAHHDRGPAIRGVQAAWEHVEKRLARYQTVVTAVLANRACIDGVEVIVQQPHRHEEEMAYLKETVRASYDQMAAVQGRLLELLHHLLHRRRDKQRTEIALELVQQLEREGHCPQAHYAFDNGGLTVELARCIEEAGNHWGSELECSRHFQWQGQWRCVDAGTAERRRDHRESFRPIQGRCRNGETKSFWAFTKVVRLKRYGRKRLVIVPEHETLDDAPRFLRTDALHWERGRVMETWSDRGAAESFQEFGKQGSGLEAAPGRKSLY